MHEICIFAQEVTMAVSKAARVSLWEDAVWLLEAMRNEGFVQRAVATTKVASGCLLWQYYLRTCSVSVTGAAAGQEMWDKEAALASAVSRHKARAPSKHRACSRI